MTIFGKPWTKQLLDQSGHLFGGVGLSALLTISITGWQAIPFVALFGYLREVGQHDWDWSIGGGRALDASFFAVGSIIWALVLI